MIVSIRFQWRGKRDRSHHAGIDDADDARLIPTRVVTSRWKVEVRYWRNQLCLLLVVHGVHSGSSLVIGREADETETAAAAGITVLDDGLGEENRSLRRLWGNQFWESERLTASSTTPNSSKRWRRLLSSVFQERPLENDQRAHQIFRSPDLTQ